MTNTLRRIALSATIVVTTGGLIHAHPGHGTTDPQALTHQLEPVHAIPWIAIGALLAAAGLMWCTHRRSSRR